MYIYIFLLGILPPTTHIRSCVYIISPSDNYPRIMHIGSRSSIRYRSRAHTYLYYTAIIIYKLRESRETLMAAHCSGRDYWFTGAKSTSPRRFSLATTLQLTVSERQSRIDRATWYIHTRLLESDNARVRRCRNTPHDKLVT